MKIFSGIRPSGDLHIGNYLGAIKQWIKLQEENDCVFCIVDLHALTTPWNPKLLQKNILEAAVAYLAAGLDPEKCVLFVQSQVKEHAELTWLLNNLAPVSELFRMTQYKEKAKQFKENVNIGLLDYPILMAADILLYQAEGVPVGKDQEQHVELTRIVARKFNAKFGDTFKEPKTLLSKTGAKIMSLQDPKKKMSKTGNPKGCISLFDEPNEIKKKVMSAVTDTGKTIKYSPTTKPGISNLLTIYSLFADTSIEETEKEFAGKGYGVFKKALTELLASKLEPFRKKRKELLAREVYTREILNQGARKAQVIASSTMQQVKEKMGLL